MLVPFQEPAQANAWRSQFEDIAKGDLTSAPNDVPSGLDACNRVPLRLNSFERFKKMLWPLNAGQCERRQKVALANGNVTFRWRDSAHGNQKRLMTVPVEEFLRRFLLHLLPRGFMRIRNFGFLANRATRYPPAALLPTAPRLREHNCFTDIAARRSASVAMELSRLRWNHARR